MTLATVEVPSGDLMFRKIYDPTAIVGDAFSMDNMVETAGLKILTSAERADIAANTVDRHVQDSDLFLDFGNANQVSAAELRVHVDDSSLHFTEGSISHLNIQDIGTNSHVDIDAHIVDVTLHRIINDAGTSTIELYSASKIAADIAAVANNADMKDGVRTTATSNITLSGNQTINGYLTIDGDRVGVVGQTDPTENGIYIADSGAWSRSTDMDADSELTNGARWAVGNTSSTKNGFSYICTTPDPITIGVTATTWTEIKRIEFGVISGTATEGNDPRVPSQDENDALVGTGTPSSANVFVTNDDGRLHSSTSTLSEGSNLYYTDVRVSANSDVTANTTHRTSTGNDHGFIDQDVTILARPQHAGMTLGTSAVQGVLHVAGTGPAIAFVSKFGNDSLPSAIIMRKARGTEGTPLAILLNDNIMSVTSSGYDGTAFDTTTRFRINASENWSVGNHGSEIQIFTTPNGTDTPQVSATFGNDGILSTVERIFAEGREVTMNADGFTPIHLVTDFPTPSGGVITLLANNEDRIKGLGLTHSDRFAIPDSGTNNLKAEAFNIHTLTYTGSDTYFTGGSVGFFQFFLLTMFGNTLPFTQGSATLFDIIGDPALPVKQVSFDQSRADNFASLGTLNDIRLFINSTALLNNGGLTLINSNDLRVNELIMFNFVENTNDVFFTIDGDQDLTGKITGLTATTFSSESVVDIRPNIGDNSSFELEGNTFLGTGSVFKSGVTGNITAIADASIGATSISAVVDSGGVARFPFTGPTVFQFQKVTISGYTTSPTYNGTFIITNTDGTSFFEISKIAFDTAETGGSFTSDSITVTSTVHARSDGEGLSIRDSVNHNIGSYVYNALANTFQVNNDFTATETATWDTGSLTQEDKQIISTGNAGLKDSKTIGSFQFNENGTVSSISDGAYGEMTFSVGSNFKLGINAQLFTLVDPLNGTIRYDGAIEFDTTYDAIFHTSLSPTEADYRVSVAVNDTDPDYNVDDSDIGYMVLSLKDKGDSVHIEIPIVLQPGDTVRPSIAGQGTSVNLILAHGQGSAK